MQDFPFRGEGLRALQKRFQMGASPMLTEERPSYFNAMSNVNQVNPPPMGGYPPMGDGQGPGGPPKMAQPGKPMGNMGGPRPRPGGPPQGGPPQGGGFPGSGGPPPEILQQMQAIRKGGFPGSSGGPPPGLMKALQAQQGRGGR